jgi:hypothetical protein
LPIPDDYPRRKIQCPQCGVFCEVPVLTQKAASRPKRSGEHPKPPAPEPTTEETELPPDVWTDPYPQPPSQIAEPEETGTDEDDGRPYRVGGKEYKCPECKEILTAEAKLCPKCGFNLETGKKAVRVYEPLERHWEAGMPLQRRVRLFILSECVILAVALPGAILAGSLTVFLTTWLTFTILLAFVLGTFDHLDLTRNKRGKVVLTQTWRVLFFTRPATTIALREYEGVMTGLSYDVGCLDWAIFLILLPMGVVPGLWWLWAMRQNTYSVALTKDHGFPERILYRGWNQTRAKEIAQVLHEVTGLPLEGV